MLITAEKVRISPPPAKTIFSGRL